MSHEVRSYSNNFALRRKGRGAILNKLPKPGASCKCSLLLIFAYRRMSEIKVKVIKGQETVEVSINPEHTFGDLRRKAEKSFGVMEGGLRLLHKSSESSTLSSGKVVNGTRMMALKTAKQANADDHAEKARRDAEATSLRQAAVSQSTTAAASTSVAASGKPATRGHPEVAGQTHVLLIKGREKFRANVELSATVGDLKRIASGLDGMNAAARDMKMLFRGVMKDEAVLSAIGIRSGSSIMLMFGARYHDANDARAELIGIEKEVDELQERVRVTISQAKSRLLEGVDLGLANGAIHDTIQRLKDNVESVRGEEERRGALEKRLESINTTFEEGRKAYGKLG